MLDISAALSCIRTGMLDPKEMFGLKIKLVFVVIIINKRLNTENQFLNICKYVNMVS
jgi:hypothetical protein